MHLGVHLNHLMLFMKLGTSLNSFTSWHKTKGLVSAETMTVLNFQKGLKVKEEKNPFLLEDKWVRKRHERKLQAKLYCYHWSHVNVFLASVIEFELRGAEKKIRMSYFECNCGLIFHNTPLDTFSFLINDLTIYLSEFHARDLKYIWLL